MQDTIISCNLSLLKNLSKEVQSCNNYNLFNGYLQKDTYWKNEVYLPKTWQVARLKHMKQLTVINASAAVTLLEQRPEILIF